MKKSLVLAMAMALGVTASAYAANPFSDVPAGHWAYDSIDKLAAAGVIEGMGDGTYQGDKTMTRYEMAQIVAKAMAKGANVDKLAAEFADELDNLGVRVANLEKKADNVKIAGNIRTHYAKYDGQKYKNSNNGGAIRSRLIINGKINDKWSYTGRIQNIQKYAGPGSKGVGEETTTFNWAYVTGKIGGMDVRAGRTWIWAGNGMIYDGTIDGVVLNYGSKVKAEFVYGQPTDANQLQDTNFGKVIGGSLSSNIGKLGLSAGYYNLTAGDFETSYNWGAKYPKYMDKNDRIFTGAATYKIGQVKLGANYYHSNWEGRKGGDGFMGSVNYKGAKATKPGSYGLEFQYMDLPAGVAACNTMNGNYYSPLINASINKDGEADGFRGIKAAGYYTLAKNMVAGVEWFNLDNKDRAGRQSTLWSQLIVTF